MPDRIAYLPLNTYPADASDDAILAALGLAGTLGCKVQVATFAVDIPPVASPLAGFLINVEGMARAAEDRSKAECERLRAMIEAHATDATTVQFINHTPVMGGAIEMATFESRYFDLTLLPWSANSASVEDMAQSLIFSSGPPVVLVPPTPKVDRVDHIAIAWDESRVAARALGDALRLLEDGGKVTVLTVQDEKALSDSAIAETLAVFIELRGYSAKAVNLKLGGRPIAAALQDAAIAEGAQLLAMGGFGHSRFRDFVLGGATKGVLLDLRLPTLLAH
jgi:nucleotide-binding universal stress UspA family protein